MKKKVHLLYFAFGLLSILFISIGYSALNTNLTISGEAYVRVNEYIRISEIKMIEATNGAYETYNSKFSKDTTSIFATLPNANSSITYQITIKNASQNIFTIEEFIEQSVTNPNVSYEIIGLKEFDQIEQTKTFTIKLTTTKTNQQADIVLKYRFESWEMLSPTITGGSDQWTTQAKTISVSIPGAANGGVKNYEYYVASNDTLPTELTEATGTTDNTLTIDTEGISYIYYRTVSNALEKSAWSNTQIVKIDRTNPVVIISGPTQDITSDPTFKNGYNNISVYNNLQNGNVTITRQAMTTPTGSGYGLKIQTTGTANPYLGGFFNVVYPKFNDIYIHKIVAKIPVGYTIHPASNYLGKDAQMYWITDNEGTGDWFEYIAMIKVGSELGGSYTSLGTLGHIFLLGDKIPVTWYVASESIYKVNSSSTTKKYWIEFKDNLELKGYNVTTSSAAPTTWNAPKKGMEFTPTANTTYYFWTIDGAGNTSYKTLSY